MAMDAQARPDAARAAAESSGLSLALFTALYELTMAQAYWQSGKTAEATFSLFIRRYPQDRSYFVLGGVHDILDYLEALRFSDADIAYLRSIDRFDEEFLGFLSELRFTGAARAMPEGSVFFANEPVLEITAPVIEGRFWRTTSSTASTCRPCWRRRRPARRMRPKGGLSRTTALAARPESMRPNRCRASATWSAL